MAVDPRLIKFMNEELRPLCERLRALAYEIDAAKFRWAEAVKVLPPGSNDVVDDGRSAEGVSRLTVQNVLDAVTVLDGVRAATSDATVAKPCVRSLEVTVGR